MDIFTSMDVSASALKAQRIRLNTISSNLANVETTSTPEGGPYKKKSVYFQSKPIPFREALDRSIQGVEVTKIIEDTSEPKKVYDPSHPDAAEDGYVEMPNISVLKEMVDMMSATRAYEANTTVIKSAKRMALKALEIGR
ncbi:MAG: flagellar basal body rod protein FlgC [Desulfocapsa sp.]|uniref:Flagellar basal-body rod protein FlgC n=1 Tax=Desulfotalea psychrophila TaxID=84980 RepID=A0ABS3AVY5_9BACT|nr:flagellar basal body rod protein FlgC [Desulfocapsa sp.]MBN4048747.1 flagellar basal body rod protein FlgC [bacterium AH-315-N22]MBN4068914.1 flagellar basal body rod protein FlgC [Desulfotalea psychrophila]